MLAALWVKLEILNQCSLVYSFYVHMDAYIDSLQIPWHGGDGNVSFILALPCKLNLVQLNVSV